MKIYSMTATFGKLEHQTLELKPGLNVIEAPNEWGKSTWCAFLVNMLYGIDTRERTTKTALAEKDRYAPWSGAPMAGRINLCWNGRDITIERSSKGRLIFGDFRAYETATGLDVPELNANNCGEMLLGVERSVFTRAGFLKLSDLPLTQDDALRRRLNALVTTGDESGAGDKLGQKLKELKNKCRYNKSGLLPQAEAQRDQLEQQIYDLQDLSKQITAATARQQELDAWVSKLENHKAALAYARAVEDASHVEQAEEVCTQAHLHLQNLEKQCRELPTREAALQALQTAKALEQRQMEVQTEARLLPEAPATPEIPERYRDMTGDRAVARATEDADKLIGLKNKKKTTALICWIFMVLGAAAAAASFVCKTMLPAPLPLILLAAGAGVTVLTAVIFIILASKLHKQRKALLARYGSADAAAWVADARSFADRQKQYDTALDAHQKRIDDLENRRQALDADIHAFAKGQELTAAQQGYQDAIAAWDKLSDAKLALQQAQTHAAALRAMANSAQKPKFPDDLTQTKEETDTLLAGALLDQKQTRQRLGQLQGQAESYGQEPNLRQQLKQVRLRIALLEDYYHALEVAQNALYAATSELQRRFAPRITKRTQELFGKLTGGRYDRLVLSEDLSLSLGAEQEDTLRESAWRSDGTVDQLYLALRLAVAEELTPEAPLVLDDAFVRFDDKRLAAAMDILQESAQTKQIILFTCQSRENQVMDQ